MANIVVFHWRDYTHPEQGGSTTSMTNVAEGLVKAGHTVTWLCEKHSQTVPHTEVHNGITYIRTGNKYTQYITAPLYFLKHLKHNTDLIIEDYDAWPYLTPLLHTNVFIHFGHIQNEEWIMEFGPFVGPILRFFAHNLLRLVYKKQNFITVSESSVQSLFLLGITPKNATIIPVGIDDIMFTDHIPKKPSDKIICCTPGRLKSHKRVDISINLVASYNKNRNSTEKEVHFDIIGGGNHEPYLRQLVKELDAEKYIHFHGKASDEVKRDLLARAHLHLQCSKREGWGMTVIEAACQGAPTLCVDIPGLRDSVSTDTGYLARDVDELFTLFPKIITDISTNSSDYRQKCTNAFTYAQQFKWVNILKLWDRLILQSLRGAKK